ncbi:hypothetical protein EGW08_021622, partial [Elysia chlorotica]
QNDHPGHGGHTVRHRVGVAVVRAVGVATDDGHNMVALPLAHHLHHLRVFPAVVVAVLLVVVVVVDQVVVSVGVARVVVVAALVVALVHELLMGCVCQASQRW